MQQLLINNIRSNCTVASTLLRGYAKLGKTDKMIELFKQEFMFDPENKGSYKSIDVSTINAVFECCLKQEMIHEIEMIYSNYLEANQSIPSQTSLVLVKGFCKIRRVDKAVEFWKQLNKLNIHVDETFYNSLVNGCAKNLDNETALSVVSDALLNKIKINTSTLNAIMDSCVSNERFDQGLELLNIIKQNDLVSDNITFCILAKGVKNSSQKEILLKLFEVLLNSSCKEPDSSKLFCEAPDHHTFNIMIDSCINCGELKIALKIFELMSDSITKPDQVTFNTLIKGCAKTKEIDTAFKLLNTMIEADFKPNIFAFKSLIDVCIRCGQQEKDWEIYIMMEGENNEENSIQGCGNAQNCTELSTNSPEYDEIQHNFTYCTFIKGINPSGNQFQYNMNLNRAFKILDKL